MNAVRELNDAELDVVSGGMDCQSAKIVASVYALTGLALHALGDTKGGEWFDAVSIGVRVGGGC
jgi:hypothetical protein